MLGSMQDAEDARQESLLVRYEVSRREV